VTGVQTCALPIFSTATTPAQLDAQTEVVTRHSIDDAFETSLRKAAPRQEWERRLASAGAQVRPAAPGVTVLLGRAVTGEVISLSSGPEVREEWGLLVRYREAQVLVAPSLPEGWNGAEGTVAPQVVFISGGPDVAARWPAQVVIVSGAPLLTPPDAAPRQMVLATAGQKDIVLRTDGRRLRVTEGRDLASTGAAAPRQQPR
jgi:hypothetical protein